MIRASASHGRSAAILASRRYRSLHRSSFATLSPTLSSLPTIQRQVTSLLSRSALHNHHSYPTPLQKRSYVFLPSSLNDATKLLRTLFDSPSSGQHPQHLTLKLQTRYQDTLAKIRERLLKLKAAKLRNSQRLLTLLSEQRQRTDKFTSAYRANYGNDTKSLRSVRAWHNGKRFLLSHMNAKRRVYARRRKGRQQWLGGAAGAATASLDSKVLLTKGAGLDASTLMEKIKQKYFLGKQRWMGRSQYDVIQLMERYKEGEKSSDGDAISPVAAMKFGDINDDKNNNSCQDDDRDDKNRLNRSNGKSEFIKTVNNHNDKSNKNNNSSTTWVGITLTEPSQQSWFDAEGYPLTSRDPETGRFVNPWLSESTNGENGLRKFLRWKFQRVGKMLNEYGINIGVDLQGNHYTDGNGTKSVGNEIQTTSHDSGFNSALPHSSGLSKMGMTSALKETRYSSSLAQTNMHDDAGTNDSIHLTWVGHSTTLVELPGDFTILTDPHFSNYAGPMKRNAPPSLSVNDLPDIVDVVLISHDHYDHLDYWSILQLVDSNKVQFWAVPLGLKDWLMNQAGVCPEKIVELEWWEGVHISKDAQTQPTSAGDEDNTIFSTSALPEVVGLVRKFDITNQRNAKKSPPSNYEKNEMIITCAPSQHWCSRTPFDRNKRLWCSWAVHATPSKYQSPTTTTTPTTTPQTHSFYFAGDTGLPSEFPLHRQIGDRLGPFDLAAIPIGAYEPRWFMREAHCNPAEAVKIHQAVRARQSVAIHYDTFDLADEPREEPPHLLLKEVGRVNEGILRMAAEVVAAAEEVKMVAELEAVSGGSVGGGGEIVDALSASPSVLEEVAVAEVGENLVEMLPSLVDFAAIGQGQRFQSMPKAV